MEGYIKRTLIGDPLDVVEAVFDNEKSWGDVLEQGLEWATDINASARDFRKVMQNRFDIGTKKSTKKGKKGAKIVRPKRRI